MATKTATPRARSAHPAAPHNRLTNTPDPAPPRQQRRKSLLGLGIALIVLGILAGAWYGSRNEESRPVLVTNRPVLAGEVLTKDQLRTAPFATDSALNAIPIDQVDVYVGKILTGSLPAGTLLLPAMLTDEMTLPDSTSLVGLPLTPAQMPSTALRPGDRVTAVMGVSAAASAAGSAQSGLTAPGRTWVAKVVTIGPAQDTGLVTIDLAVPDETATDLAAAAASGNVSLVLHPHPSAGVKDGPTSLAPRTPELPADDAGQTTDVGVH